jgi:hypothetical protein
MLSCTAGAKQSTDQFVYIVVPSCPEKKDLPQVFVCATLGLASSKDPEPRAINWMENSFYTLWFRTTIIPPPVLPGDLPPLAIACPFHVPTAVFKMFTEIDTERAARSQNFVLLPLLPGGSMTAWINVKHLDVLLDASSESVKLRSRHLIDTFIKDGSLKSKPSTVEEAFEAFCDSFGVHINKLKYYDKYNCLLIEADSHFPEEMRTLLDVM